MNIEVKDSEINVQEIIAKMKVELGKHTINEDLSTVTFEQYGKTEALNIDLKELYSKVDIVNRSWNSNPEFLITSHRRILGPFIVNAKKLIRKMMRWYINPYTTLQNEFNGNLTRTMNELFTQFKNTVDQFQIINQQLDVAKTDLSKKNEQIEMLKNQYKKITDNYEALNESLNNDEYEVINSKVLYLEQYIYSLEGTLSTKVEGVNTKLDNVGLRLENVDVKLENTDAKLESIKASAEITTIKNNTRVMVERLRRIERKLKQIGSLKSYEDIFSSTLDNSNITKENQGLDFDYFLFEEYYRGSREEIIDRQKQYLPYFSEAKNVLDLGCGRGEFTELMLEAGINVVSVDLDDDMVDYCKDRGFNIQKMNLLDYLKTIEDSSVDGIFLGQVIEHMKAEDVILMVKLAYRKLKPNAWLIAETPNPRSLSIFAQSFYLDLTHNKPVHPFTSKFIWETEGFRDVEVQYFSPNNPIVQLPPLEITSMDQDVLNKFNTGLQYWNDTLFGNQDYFVAGKK
ncbi:methyltransferase domain-containing protein [Paenibacillus phytohabitans]|uniref:methyltransferase domain-containing protein n=1 Tax=Paenibacillus phytohabitans TaxID=2654978 RepID=UPI00300B2781